MINKNEIINAIQRVGYVALTVGGERRVYEWKRDKRGEDTFFDNCPIFNHPECIEVCKACLELDNRMPIEEEESEIGAFVLASKTTVQRAELNNQSK